MPPQPNRPVYRRETRREFIKKAGIITAAAATANLSPFSLLAAPANAGVAIVLDPSDELTQQAPVQWAAGQLQDALTVRGVNAMVVATLEAAPQKSLCVFVTGNNAPVVKQALAANGYVFPASPESLAMLEGKLSLTGRRC
jgi:hypothetical protein